MNPKPPAKTANDSTRTHHLINLNTICTLGFSLPRFASKRAMKSDHSTGLAALLSPNPDLLWGWRIADVPVLDVDLRLSSALAAAQLAFTAAADGLASRVIAKADAWLPPLPFDSTSGSTGGCPLGFSNPAVYKQYPIVQVPSTLSLLTPKQLLWLFLKNTGIVLLLQVRIDSGAVAASARQPIVLHNLATPDTACP